MQKSNQGIMSAGLNIAAGNPASYRVGPEVRGMSRALLKRRSGRCHVYSTSSCCFVKHLFV
jgi:hypothetical protein